MSLLIYIPSAFLPEVSYVFDVLLKENLNITDYSFEESESEDVIIKNTIGSITIENVFFKGKYEDLFVEKNLPPKRVNVTHEDIEITALYGNETITAENNNYFVGADIIGSSFFMLTQWESTIKQGDYLGRYKYETSTLKKLDLYHTPIVNQYIMLLKKLLEKIGVHTKLNEYKPEFSCDVDSITKYKSFRNLFGGLYHRKSFEVISEYIQSRVNKKNDPYFSFDYLISVLKEKKVDATFYFMTDVEDKKYDTVDYDLNETLIQNLFQKLSEVNYKIGLHPSINSWKSKESIRNQRLKLEEAINVNVDHIRQHYLRYDVKETISSINELGFVSDSSIQFTDGCGFAAGICTPYSLFDLKNRKKTNVIETPLVYMKKKDYVLDVDISFEKIKRVIDIAKKYNGRFSVLFHNADLETENEKRLFERVINKIKL